MDIDTVLDRWRLWQTSQGLSDRTITERATTMRHLFTLLNVEALELEPLHIMTFCARKEISNATKASYHATIRAYCSWLVRADMRPDNPSLKTPSPRRPIGQPRPVPGEILSQLFKIVNRKRTRTYLLLAALAGLRVHEIAKIRGEDIAGGVLTVVGKGGKIATIPLHDLLIEESTKYPKVGSWFPAYTGSSDSIHPKAVSDAIGNAMSRIGYVGNAHQLRHFYATELLRQGVDLRVVQTLMRHESPATTAIYTKVDFAHQIAGIRTLSLTEAA